LGITTRNTERADRLNKVIWALDSKQQQPPAADVPIHRDRR